MRKVTKAEKQAAAKAAPTKAAKKANGKANGHGRGGNTRDKGEHLGLGLPEPKGGKEGLVLKAVFPEFEGDPEKFKKLRTYMRKHWRAEPVLRHDKHNRWVVAKNEVKVVRGIAKDIGLLN
jgi:hypothetical protein